MKQLVKYFFKFLIALLVLVVGFYFWASSPTLNSTEYSKLSKIDGFKSPINDTVFSIMTYNIGYLSGMTNNRAIAKPKELFDKNLEKVLVETKKVNPDIIAFQEIDYNASRSYNINQEQEIINLGYGYSATAINWDERYVPFPYWPISMHFGKVVSGQSILSKYPLKNHERVVLERVANAPFYRDAFYLERLAQVAIVTLGGKDVVLINIHLEAFDGNTRTNQFQEVVSIFNRYKEKYPTILLGDFNSRARDTNAVVQQLFAIDDIGNAAFTKENPENTFDTKSPFERIDYIFYTKNTIECISGKVVTEFGESSDHLPVYMEFRLK